MKHLADIQYKGRELCIYHNDLLDEYAFDIRDDDGEVEEGYTGFISYDAALEFAKLIID